MAGGGRLLWVTYRGGKALGHSATREAAQNLVERPYWPGNAMVRNARTGETWERRGGSWLKTQAHWPARPARPAKRAG